MIELSLDKRYLSIKFEYEPQLVEFIKLANGRIFDRLGHRWLLPLSNSSTADFVMALSRFNTTISYQNTSREEIDNRLREMVVARSILIKSNESEDCFGDDRLYSFQRVGVEFMVNACRLYGGVLNACEVGLGKTAMMAMTIQALQCRSILILAPKSVLWQLQSEFAHWIGKELIVYVGNPKQRLILRSKLFGIVIMSYETLRQDFNLLPHTWDIICCDEIQRLGSRDTKLYKCVSALSAEYRIGASATPIMNRLGELYSEISWLIPGYLGTWQQFLDRYCIQDYWGSIKNGQNLDELKERLRTVMFRRTVKQVQISIPPVTYEILPIELSEKERKLYDKVKKELLFEIDKEEVSKLSSPMILQNTLVKMGKLIEICDSLELLGDSTQSSKIEALKDHLRDIIINNKVIIFTRFSRMAFILERELVDYEPAIITGGHSNWWRQEALEKFNNDDNCRIIIGTLAMSAGLNIQTASVIYHVDLPFSVGAYLQRTGRAVRIGQTRPVLVINIITTGTIEAHVQKLLASKISLARELLDDESVFGTLDQVREVLKTR